MVLKVVSVVMLVKVSVMFVSNWMGEQEGGKGLTRRQRKSYKAMKEYWLAQESLSL